QYSRQYSPQYSHVSAGRVSAPVGQSGAMLGNIGPDDTRKVGEPCAKLTRPRLTGRSSPERGAPLHSPRTWLALARSVVDAVPAANGRGGPGWSGRALVGRLSRPWPFPLARQWPQA